MEVLALEDRPGLSWIDFGGPASPIVMLMGAGESACDEELLGRLLAGDEPALVAIYDRFSGDLYRFALRMSGSPSVAEDVTQEVFLALVRGPARYDPARGAFAHYLYGIARHKLQKRLEKDRPYVVLEEGPEDVDTSAPGRPDGVPALRAREGRKERGTEDALAGLLRRERVGLVWRALLALPPHYREVVVLCDLQHLSYGEASAILACAVGTVRSRLHRGRDLVAEKLRSIDAVRSTTRRESGE